METSLADISLRTTFSQLTTRADRDIGDGKDTVLLSPLLSHNLRLQPGLQPFLQSDVAGEQDLARPVKEGLQRASGAPLHASKAVGRRPFESHPPCTACWPLHATLVQSSTACLQKPHFLSLGWQSPGYAETSAISWMYNPGCLEPQKVVWRDRGTKRQISKARLPNRQPGRKHSASAAAAAAQGVPVCHASPD